jgi:hypothetical protein
MLQMLVVVLVVVVPLLLPPLVVPYLTRGQSQSIGLVPGSGLGFILRAGCQTAVGEGWVGARGRAFVRGWW